VQVASALAAAREVDRQVRWPTLKMLIKRDHRAGLSFAHRVLVRSYAPCLAGQAPHTRPTR
jgi:hypothetical protein